MKKNIILIIALILSILSYSFGNNDSLDSLSTNITSDCNGVIYIKRDALPPNQLKKLNDVTQLSKVENVMETIDEFKGSVDPREIGIAIDTVGSIFTTQANEIAETRVGKFILFIVGWKVFGGAVTGILVKIPYLLFVLWLFLKSWKKLFIVRNFPTKVRKDGRFNKKTPISYQTINNSYDIFKNTSDSASKEMRFFSKLILVGMLLISIILTFTT